MLSSIFTVGFLVSLLAGTIRLATPILLPALGQIYTQRAGILNLGVEGTMTIGAVAGFSAAYKTGNLWIGLLSGMFFGMLWSLIMAWLSVTMRANQVIAGIALNILGAGTAVYVYRILFGVQSLPPQITPFAAVNIPVLSSLPVIGQIFFQHNILVYLSYVMVFVTWFILEKTTFGLKIRAVGEHPRAADSKGISVAGVRYAAVLIGGLYARCSRCIYVYCLYESFHRIHCQRPWFYRRFCCYFCSFHAGESHVGCCCFSVLPVPFRCVFRPWALIWPIS